MIREKYKEEKMYGVYHFGQRNLVVTDLELAKLMLVKDADHFTESFAVGTEYKDAHGEIEKLFSLMLTNMKGDEWKKVSVDGAITEGCHQGKYVF